MSERTISVAIITRNRAGFLNKALESLISQTRLPDQVLVVDNGSTDNTRLVVEQMTGHLPIDYVIEEQIGINFARNKAMRSCSGDILAFIDDDAVAEKVWVERIVQAFQQYPDAMAVQGRTGNLFPDNLFASLLQFISQDMPKLRDREGHIVRSPSMICSMNLAFLLQPIKEAGICFDTNVPRGGDRNFGHQVLRNKMMIIYAEEAVNYHHWPTTLKGYMKLRWKAGVAKALLKERFTETSFQQETKQWGAAQMLSVGWQHTTHFPFFKRLGFLLLLFAGKILSEVAQQWTKRNAER